MPIPRNSMPRVTNKEPFLYRFPIFSTAAGFCGGFFAENRKKKQKKVADCGAAWIIIGRQYSFYGHTNISEHVITADGGHM